jgi:uncharacterized protein (TIGR00251 family)
MLNEALLFLLDVLLQPFAAILLLRFHLQWLRAPLRNPVGEFVMILTDFLVLRVRRFIPSVRGLDLGQTAQDECVLVDGRSIRPSDFVLGKPLFTSRAAVDCHHATISATFTPYRTDAGQRGFILVAATHHLPAYRDRAYQCTGTSRARVTLMADWYRRDGETITLTLHVQPGAKRSEIVGLHGETLKIKLAAPPIEGRANEALLKFIADLFAVPLRNAELKQGGQSRRKVVAVIGSKVEPESLLTVQ